MKLTKFINYFDQENAVSEPHNLKFIRNSFLNFLDNISNEALMLNKEHDLLGSIKRLIESVDLPEKEVIQVLDNDQRAITQSSVHELNKTIESHQPIRFDDNESETDWSIMSTNEYVNIFHLKRFESEVNAKSVNVENTPSNSIDPVIEKIQSDENSFDLLLNYSNDLNGINLDNSNIPISFDNLNMFSDEEISQSTPYNDSIIPDETETVTSNSDFMQESISGINCGNRSKHPHLINENHNENESSSDNESDESDMKQREHLDSSLSDKLEIELEINQSMNAQQINTDAKIQKEIATEINLNPELYLSKNNKISHIEETRRRVYNESICAITTPNKRMKHEIPIENKEGIPESIVGCENIPGPVCDDIEIITNSSSSLVGSNKYSNCKPENYQPKTISRLLSVDIDCPLNMIVKPSSSSIIQIPNQTSNISLTHFCNLENCLISNNLQKNSQSISTELSINPLKSTENPQKSIAQLKHKENPQKSINPLKPIENSEESTSSLKPVENPQKSIKLKNKEDLEKSINQLKLTENSKESINPLKPTENSKKSISPLKPTENSKKSINPLKPIENPEKSINPKSKENQSIRFENHPKSESMKPSNPDAIRTAEIERRIKLAEKKPVQLVSNENHQIKLTETSKRLSEKKISTVRKEFPVINRKNNNLSKRFVHQQTSGIDLMELRPIARENLIMERMTKQDFCDGKITQFKTDSISGTKRKREDLQLSTNKQKITKLPKSRKIIQSKPTEETKSTSKLLNVNLGQYLLRHHINEENIIKHQRLVTFTAYNPILPLPLPGAIENESEENRNEIPIKNPPIKCNNETTNQIKTIPEFSQSKLKPLKNEQFIENQIVNLLNELTKENENDFIRLIGQRLPIATENDAKLLIDGMFNLFKLNKDKLFKRTFLINAIFQLVVSIISRCQKVYSYYYSNLLAFIKSMEIHSGLVVILATISIFISLQQWDRIVGFFVDLLRLPNIFLLKLVSVVTPNNIFPQQTGTKYDSITGLFKRLVIYEYSTTSDEECKKLFSNTSIEVQRFWLNGQTVANFQPMNDLQSVIELANQITEEYKSKNLKFKLDLLDKDLEMKYFIK